MFVPPEKNGHQQKNGPMARVLRLRLELGAGAPGTLDGVVGALGTRVGVVGAPGTLRRVDGAPGRRIVVVAGAGGSGCGTGSIKGGKLLPDLDS